MRDRDGGPDRNGTASDAGVQRRGRWRRYSLKAISILLALGCVGSWLYPGLAEWLAGRRHTLGKGREETRLRLLIRKADDMCQVYTLKPSTVLTITHGAAAAHYRINAFGLRGRQCTIPKPEGLTRIALYGGSPVFGVGLEEEATLPAALERRLRAANGAERVEVLNLGIPRSNTVMDVERYKSTRRQLDPDVVVFLTSEFTLDMPGWMQENWRVRFPPSQHSYPDSQLVPTYWDDFTFHLEPSKHTIFYWDIVGVANALKSLRQAHRLASDAEAELLVLVDHIYFPVSSDGKAHTSYYNHAVFTLVDGCKRLGVRTVSLLDISAGLMRDLGATDCHKLFRALPDRTPITQKIAAIAQLLSQEIRTIAAHSPDEA